MATAADRKYQGLSPDSRRAVILIAIVSLLNAMAAMIIIPVLPMLVKEFTGDTEHAAAYVGGFAAIFAVAQFLAAPVLGALSDAFGRRRVILVSACGLAVDYLIMGFAPSVNWLLIGRVIAGFTSASAPAVNAYIADSIEPRERAGAYGWIGAAFAVGFLAGPAIGGILGNIDPRLPFWISAILCFAMAIYGTFLLPESLPVERRVRFTLARANSWSSVRLLIDNASARSLLLVLMMMMMAATCLPATLVLYTDFRFGWSTATVGIYLTFAGAGHLLVQSLLVRRFVARFGERTAAVTGYTSVGIGFLIFASVPHGVLFPIGTPFYALTGLVTPAIQSRLTQAVAHDEQGLLQGTVAAAQALAGLLAPIFFTQIFAFAVTPGHGWVPVGLHLYAGSAILFCGALLAWRKM